MIPEKIEHLYSMTVAKQLGRLYGAIAEFSDHSKTLTEKVASLEERLEKLEAKSK